jgi:hypothetical protein
MLLTDRASFLQGVFMGRENLFWPRKKYGGPLKSQIFEKNHSMKPT